ncbi:hypothetical protein LINGRAHAP2_LOCUS16627 [Linum grandiflorum]
MSYSTGNGSHHHLLIFFSFNFFFFFLIVLASAENDHVGFVISGASREEMVELAGYGEEKLSTVLVTGSVVCQACSASVDRRDLHQLHEWPVPGAVVAVNCRTRGKKKHRKSTTTPARTVTDEYGDFMIDLPSELHGIADFDNMCCVEVLRMPKDSACRPAYVQKHKALKLSSFGNGIRNYSAGKIQFLHTASKPLQSCGSGKDMIFSISKVTDHSRRL